MFCFHDSTDTHLGPDGTRINSQDTKQTTECAQVLMGHTRVAVIIFMYVIQLEQSNI